MEEIAKRYTKALIDKKDINEIKTIKQTLDILSKAYSNKDFMTIINSIDVSKEQKADLVVSLLKKPSKEIQNLIKLLAQKQRLDIIPAILNELEKEISKLTNSYKGIVITSKKLDDKYIKSLEGEFSKKFNINKLNLEQKVTDYDGIKVEIDDLGVEIGISTNRLKEQMIEHILKAVN